MDGNSMRIFRYSGKQALCHTVERDETGIHPAQKNPRLIRGLINFFGGFNFFKIKYFCGRYIQASLSI
jgi:hypothetical protein